MKGTNLGEFEELVMLTVAVLASEAYSVRIIEEIALQTQRRIKLGVVHAVLSRLEEKGLLRSKLGDATAVRGGKRKRYYSITAAGKNVLIRAKEQRDQLWGRIPGFSIKPL